MMSLPHALMVSLIERPCSGYDLARRFDKTIGYFWRASHQQIYRELSRMEASGWIDSTADDLSNTGRRTYAVLDAGLTELKRWACHSEDPVILRDPFFVRLRADAMVGPLGMQHELRQRMAHHQLKLDIYAVIEQRDFLSRPVTRATQIQHHILKAGVLYEQHMLTWSHDMLALLETLDGPISTPAALD
jgi:DNA-binding PadR family transcriptional regulator